MFWYFCSPRHCAGVFLMKCRFHPERDAFVKCDKMEIGYCQECLDRCEACTDPCGYCRFRSQCLIWELCRDSEKKHRLERAARGEDGEHA